MDRLQGEGSIQVQNLSSVPALGPPTVVILGGMNHPLKTQQLVYVNPFFRAIIVM